MNEPKTIEAEVIPPQQTQALVVRQSQEVAPSNLFGTQEPVAIIQKATDVATALKAVISQQGLISKISGKEYPKCEAWTLLGTMLGVFPVLAWSKPIEGGFEARVEAKTRDGAVVGAAEAQCLRSERNWSNRDDFALRSMAQTRATAKCLRMPLGFVMTLAGYEPTPAEEMVSDHPRPQDAPRKPEPAKVVSSPPAEAKRPTQAAQAPAKAPVEPQPPQKRNIATVKTKVWFIEQMEPCRDLATEYFQKLTNPDVIIPTETLSDVPLWAIPVSWAEMRALKEKIAGFGNGEDATWAYEVERLEPSGLKPLPKMVEKAVETVTNRAKDPEWWRKVIISVPRKGMKRDEYLKKPDTIGSLFDLRHGSDDEAQAARERLFGLVNNWECAPREYNGKIYQPSEADKACREALDAFAEWFEKNHPEEKL